MNPIRKEYGINLYGIGLIDVYDTEAANQCYKWLYENLNQTYKVKPDGYYLRDNTPFTFSNGTDLELSHYENGDEIIKSRPYGAQYLAKW